MNSRLPILYIIAAIGFAALVMLLQILFGQRAGTGSSLGKASQATPTSIIMDEITAVGQAGQHIYWLRGASAYQLPLESSGTQPKVLITLPFETNQAVWSPSGTSVLVRADGEGATWQFVPVVGGGKIAPLDFQVLEPTFSSDGNRILYSFSGVEQTPVAIADPNGRNWNNILKPQGSYAKLWWPGNGTVALARDIFSTPPSYVRLLISSKRTEQLANGYEEEMNAAVSPDGTHVVIDGEQAADPVLRLVTLGDGAIQPLDIRSVARLAAWQDDATVLIIQADGMVVSVDVKSRVGTQLGTLPDSLAPEQLVAATKDQLYIVSAESLLSVPRSALIAP